MACNGSYETSCSSGCWAQCSSGCGANCSASNSGQGSGGNSCSNCANGCTGGATSTTCASCTKDCQGSCSWCTSGNVNGWGSEDGGSGCICGGNCTGGCDSGCKGNCEDSCDTGCTTTVAKDLYEKLVAGLNKRILATDMTNINDMIRLEAERRGKKVSSQTFNNKEKATSTKIQALQTNLAAIGNKYKTSEDANAKIRTFKNTGQELIDKALLAYEETIKHD